MISVIMAHKPKRKIITNLNNQTYKDFETIMITDHKLRGQSWALNRGIEKAKGDHYMFLDDDLELEPTLLEELYKAIPGYSLAYCQFMRRGRVNGVYRPSEWNVEQLKKSNHISNCSMVVAKDFPGWDEDIYRLKDWDAWLTMAENGKKGILVNKVLFTAHYDKDGISAKGDGGTAEQIIRKKHGL